ncbi:MAG: glutamate racemase [Candidatus Brocadia sinica]|nr:glutamate racemase [Candidatus Brocadia sinica]NUO05112.1 glutamate racemase [Candidatus Brocadia sinica]
MENPGAKLPIGVFDSGIGGISVLAEIIKTLPYEEFVYFADILHSPYGTKQENVVRSLSIKATEFLSLLGIKSLVVACNTATSVAIQEIRKMYPFPVVGMEPAVKPAVELGSTGKILVMATPLTLKSKKFNELVYHYKHLAEIVPLPCAGLVEIIERDHSQGREITEYLSRLFSSVNKEGISSVVLGCTHYVLIKKEIVNMVGSKIVIIDGNCGTARHLRKALQNECLLNDETAKEPHIPLRAKVRFYISGDEREVMITKCKQLLQNEGIICG